MLYNYIRSSGIRKLAKENGKHCGKEFLQALDRTVYNLVLKACKMCNNHKRLEAGLIE